MTTNEEYRGLISTLIRDIRPRALTGLWMDALVQLPPIYSLTLMEEEPGPFARNFEFQADVLRELIRQLREASVAVVTTEPTGEMVAQTRRRDGAREIWSEIVRKTREWLAVGGRLNANPQVCDLVAEIIDSGGSQN